MTVAELGTGGPLDGSSQAAREGGRLEPELELSQLDQLLARIEPDLAEAETWLKWAQGRRDELVKARDGVILAKRYVRDRVALTRSNAGKPSVNVQVSADSMGVTAGNRDSEGS